MKIAIARNTIRQLSFSPVRQNMVSEPTWFTPPRSDRHALVIRSHITYESSFESDNDEGENYYGAKPRKSGHTWVY